MRILQISHFTLLGITSLLLLLFILNSDKEVDAVRIYIDNATFIVTGLWATLWFVLGLIHGEGSIISKIGQGYRLILVRKWSVVSINLLLLASVLYLGDQTHNTRRVEITSIQQGPIEVYLMPANKKLGVVLPGQNMLIRLPVGEHELYFYRSDDVEQDFPGADIINVQRWWTEMPPHTLSKI